MKTKTFLLLCLFLGIGLTQLSAQNGKDGTGIYSEYFTVDAYSVPAYCSGEPIGILSGSLNAHYTALYKKGELIWCKSQIHGEAVSNTGEVFKVQAIAKVDDILETGTIHVNFMGNNGTHYIGIFAMDYSTGELTPVKVVCPGDDK